MEVPKKVHCLGAFSTSKIHCLESPAISLFWVPCQARTGSMSKFMSVIIIIIIIIINIDINDSLSMILEKDHHFPSPPI